MGGLGESAAALRAERVGQRHQGDALGMRGHKPAHRCRGSQRLQGQQRDAHLAWPVATGRGITGEAAEMDGFLMPTDAFRTMAARVKRRD